MYCQTIKQCSIIYNILNIELGDIHHGCTKDHRYRMVEMLHSNTPEDVKQHVTKMFSQSDSHLRILVATIAYGMGVNCKNVTRVIHFGPSNTVEAYMQENGRCGREGQQSYTILLYNSITIRAANEAMKSYIRGRSCRRQSLLRVLIMEQIPHCIIRLDNFAVTFVEKAVNVQMVIVIFSWKSQLKKEMLKNMTFPTRNAK